MGVTPGRRYGVPVTCYISRRQVGAIVDGFEDVVYGPWEPVAPCAVQPGASQENLDANREAASIHFTVYGPGGVNAGARDKFRIPGRGDFDVVGMGQEFQNPYSGTTGSSILVGRYDG